MQELTLPTIRMIEAHGDTAVYAIELLEHGYGWTLGSVLQRALPSLLSGLATTGIRIAGWSPGCKQLSGISESIIFPPGKGMSSRTNYPIYTGLCPVKMQVIVSAIE